MSNNSNLNVKRSRSPDQTRDLGSKVFLGFLGMVACFYAVILFHHTSKPPGVVIDDDSVLERCRRICMKYGLVSTGNVHTDAENYLEAVQAQKLTEGLSVVLADSSFKVAESQRLPLLNQPAPEFSLPDDSNKIQELSELGKQRPVVVVFYLGYGCSHCVAQLLALDKDLHYFKELGAEIVAISSDTPDHTTEKFAEFGRFHFPVLADVEYDVSQKWGVYESETDEEPGFMNHGTFVVDRTGKIIWGTMGPEPFLDNKTLLRVLAESQGLMPTSEVAQEHAAEDMTATR